MSMLQGLQFLRQFDNFWDLAARRIAGKYRDVSIYDLKSGPAIVDRSAGDANGVWACLHWREYDEALRAIEPTIHPRRAIGVLDCGANAGGFGLLLANRDLNCREYHAVEMNPRTFGRLAYNVTNWRSFPPATAINAALAGEPGWAEMVDVYGNTGQSLFRSSDREGPGRTVRVQKVTIADLLRGDSWQYGMPELIKLDIEGAEFDVVPQLDAQLLASTDAIVMEIHPIRNRPANELVHHLESLSFPCVLRPENEWGVYVFRRS